MYPEFPVEPEHHLPFICYDRYILDAEANPYAHGCIHLDEFVHDRPVLISAPYTGNRGDIDEDVELPGEKDTHSLATEAGKKIVRTMFEAVWCIAQTGRCFETIERKHLLVSPDGSVRLWGVQIAERENIDEWMQLLRQNLRSLAAIGREVFNEQGLDVPPEITHLFNMVDEDNKANNLNLYIVHSSVIPIGIGWLAYLKMFDHVMAKISKVQRDKIYRSLEPFLANWRTRAQDNDLLTSTYVHVPGSYDLTPHKVAGLMGIDVSQFLNSPLEEQQDMTLLADAQKFMTYLRNRVAHRLEGWSDVHSYYRTHGGKVYTAEGSDYVFQIRWGEVICHIQKGLHDCGELSNLKFSHFLSGLYPKLGL